MMKSLMVDDNMSNLTFASGEISASSSTRNDQSAGNLYPQQSSASTNQPPSKKKRSLPGNPDPDAEVIALSPKTLLATNRFICEICNKGFQRDQNLQLHRRGHNLPWKLKQKTNKDVVRKKVYVCPETTCVHHDPSRALGDLTGIKKHFFRKHGEKKWKCEKCSKRYAVQSDWKAHSKICGTREYRCDCGTLFSRRDSFITHRAFCDALAVQESSSTTATTIPRPNMPPLTNPIPTLLLHQHLEGFQQYPLSAAAVKREQITDHQIPPWLAACPPPPQPSSQPPLMFSSPNLDDHSFVQVHHKPNINNINNPLTTTTTTSSSSSTVLLNIQPHVAAAPAASATALLQKAAQMGSTMSSRPSHPFLKAHEPHHHQHQYLSSDPAGAVVSGLGLSSSSGHYHHHQADHQLILMEGSSTGHHDDDHHRFGNDYEATPSLLHDMMMSGTTSHHLAPGGAPPPGIINAAGPSSYGLDQAAVKSSSHHTNNNSSSDQASHMMRRSSSSGIVGLGRGGGNDGLTRDFLGLRTFSHSDIFDIVGLDHMNSSTYANDHKPPSDQTPSWQGR